MGGSGGQVVRQRRHIAIDDPKLAIGPQGKTVRTVFRSTVVGGKSFDDFELIIAIEILQQPCGGIG